MPGARRRLSGMLCEGRVVFCWALWVGLTGDDSGKLVYTGLGQFVRGIPVTAGWLNCASFLVQIQRHELNEKLYK